MDDPQMRSVPHRMTPVVVGVAMIVATVLVPGVRPASARPLGPQSDALRERATAEMQAPTTSQPSAVVERVRTCGTLTLISADVEQVEGTLRRWSDENVPGPRGGVIRVAFHIITARGEGDVSDAQLAEQIRELNLGFEGTGYRFEFARVDRTEEPGWFRMAPASRPEWKAKEALAVEPARTLNIYVCRPAQSLAGWATYPWAEAESHFVHGVVLDYAVLPGGSASQQLGNAAIHEVGHYLGLIDTDCTWDVRTGFRASRIEHMRAVVSIYRPSLFSAPPSLAMGKPEIVPTEGAEPEDGRVLSYRGAFPNPFRAETALRFTLPTSQPVSLRIYSVTGQLVRTLVDAPLPPGDHSAMFRADDLPSGAYFAVLRAGRVQMSRTLMLIR